MKYYSAFMMAMISFFASSLTYEANANSLHYQIKPESIIYEIKSRGSKVVVSELYSDWNVWHTVLGKIASAGEEWLSTAVMLRAGSDAGSSEMLDLAVGEALESNPANVFRITSKAFQLSAICGGPDVDDARYNSYELSIKAINKRIHKVASLKDTIFEKKGNECIRYLEASKEGIARFYGVKK